MKSVEVKLGQVSIKLLSSEHGFDDYEVEGCPVHRVTVPHGIKRNGLFNVYGPGTLKRGGMWQGSIEKSIMAFLNDHHQQEQQSKPENGRVSVMQVEINFQGQDYTLTNQHEKSQNGIPVLVAPDGAAYGPWDNVIDEPDARMSGGERYHWQMTARAIAGYAKKDHPNDPDVHSLVDAFNSVRDPELERRLAAMAPGK